LKISPPYSNSVSQSTGKRSLLKIAEESIILEFDDPHQLSNLYNNDEKLLRIMEEVLGITVTTRDAWMRFTGPSAAIKRASWAFNRLQQLYQRETIIGACEFLEALHQSDLDSQQKKNDLIFCSPRKPPVVPQTESQHAYLEQIDKHDITFGLGPAGTGKTYLAVAKAVAALKQEKVSRIILTRPAVEAGEALGFLPGELKEKIFPYLRPLYDALHDMLEPEEIQRYVDKNILEIAPLAYMRGRTLNHAFIILDEAQNTTTEQMFMFLTRIGRGSRCIITGDVTQIDLPKNKPSGLLEAIAILKKTAGIGFHHFTEKDVVRHSLIQIIIKAYQKYRAN
jgi:phosphate starvation-inducible PhoH-like protein